jgi:Fe2+ transport system protein FeoA
MAPFVLNPKLTLKRLANDEILITVDYTARFFTFDRRLVGLGMHYMESIEVIGVDPAGSTTGTVLRQFFPDLLHDVTDGEGELKIPRHRAIQVKRTVLDEDSSPFVGPDAIPDQIRCRIRIEALDLTPAITVGFTNQVVLQMTQLPPAAGAPTSG